MNLYEQFESKFLMLLFGLILAVSGASQTQGQVLVWADQFGGNWHDATNWTLGGPPNANVDAVFDLPASYSVEIDPMVAHVRSLFVNNGSPTFVGATGLFIDCEVDFVVRSDIAFSPDAKLAGDMTLFADRFELISEFGLDAKCCLDDSSEIVCANILVDTPVDLDSESLLGAFAGSSLFATEDFEIVQGKVEIRTDSSGRADNLSIGLANPSDTQAIMEIVGSELLIFGTANVGFGLLTLWDSEMLATDFLEVGRPSEAGNENSELICLGDSTIDCPEVIVGLQSHGQLLVGISSSLAVEGNLSIGSEGEMRMLANSQCCADSIDVAGLINLTTGFANVPAKIDAALTLQQDGYLQVVNLGFAEILGTVTNFGAEILVESGSELDFVGNYRGQNLFIGDGEIRFHGLVQPDDPDEFAEEETGVINFDGPNVVLTSTSTFNVSFDDSSPVLHDRLNVNGNLAIQGAGITIQENPLDPFEFVAGDSFIIVNVNGNRMGGFAGQPESSVVWSNDDFELVISYIGGDGNDVTLTAMDKGVLIGDVNLDGVVDLLDVDPFVALLANGGYLAEADIDQDGDVDLLDVDPFVALLSGI